MNRYAGAAALATAQELRELLGRLPWQAREQRAAVLAELELRRERPLSPASGYGHAGRLLKNAS